MTRKILLGAPSLVGKEAQDREKNGLANATYPLTVVITNHMPRDIALPEVKDLYLKSVYYSSGSSKTVVITNEAQLKRLISSVEQISELNGYHKALTIEEVIIESPIVDKAEEKPVPEVTEVPKSPEVPEVPASPAEVPSGNLGKKAKTHHKRG
jgi:hypothetical protein